MYLFRWALPGPRGWTSGRDGAVFFVKAASPPVDFVVHRSLRSSFVFLWSKEKKQKGEDQPIRSIRRVTVTCAQVAKAQVRKWCSTVHDDTAGVLELHSKLS